MRNHKGFTLAELLIGLIVALIVTLMVGALANIAYKSYFDLRNKSGVFNDVQFALQLLEENVRQSSSAPTFASNCLTVVTSTGTRIFYINSNNFVFSTSCGSATNTPIIKGVTNLVFTPDLSNLPLIKVALSGIKNGVTFNYSNGTSDNRIVVSRRNP
jgi:prepilin-type N-terminal cleavage/methylation domain-containing protein